jgi:hypothetical protein
MNAAADANRTHRVEKRISILPLSKAEHSELVSFRGDF